MKTMFVNPSNPTKRRKRRPAKRRATMARRATRQYKPKRRVRRKARRRNAGITPFVQPRASNPLILQNPRRRKRRRNPTMNAKGFVNKLLTYSGGSAVGAGINILALRRIDNDWMRNGARVVAAVMGGMFLKGEMGAAMAGATLYPAFAELALMSGLVPGGSGGTEADLNELAADLEDVLGSIDLDDSGVNSGLYVP